jgi:hypothetical protein
MHKFLFVLLFLSTYCVAQFPETDLWLFTIKNEKGKLTIHKGENITNRKGYDNQPSFSGDEKSIYFSSVRDDLQSDIFEYSLSSKKIKQLTKSKESEYSPTPIEGTNLIACVTVQQDSSQIIVAYGKPKKGKSSDPLETVKWKSLTNFDSVGYFTFLNEDSVIYYKLTKPHSLRLRSLSTDKDVFIANNPVRGFRPLNRNSFVFGIKDSTSVRYFKYHCTLKKGHLVDIYPSTAEDIFLHPDLGVLKSEGAIILQLDEKEKQWKILFDFSSFGIQKITRFAIDSKRKSIVIVNNS